MSPASKGRRRPPRQTANRTGPSRSRTRSARQRLIAMGILIAMLALLLSMLAMTTARAAPGVEVTETGWWSRNPFASPPEGGFQVSVAPDGPVSVSAVRLATEGEIHKATLIINEAGGVPDAAAMQVCTTAAGWSGTDHGWAARPAAECGAAVAMVRNAGGANWTADITALVRQAGPNLSLVIVPTTGGAPAWQVDFSIAIVAAEAGPEEQEESEPGSQPSGSGEIVSGPPDRGGSSAGGAGSSSFGNPGGSGAIDFSGASGGLGSVTAPPDPGLTSTSDPGTSTEAAPSNDVLTSAQGFVPASTASPQPWGRLVVFVPLSMLAGVLVAVGRRRLRDRPTA